ncbi:MAG TPA: RNA polymerase sigma-70 factor [Ohtaekwangia sp.]|uniref:RNA polymerase sigma factor n=1 Tax=Ohtaekwangia sp. TaxID=2066019 RepID=UPI002F92988E
MDLTEFESLYKQQFNILCNKVYRIVRDKDIAKDVVQDVFVKLWKGRGDIQGLPEAYLYRAAINQALNYADANKRRTTAGLGYASVTSTTSPDASQTVMAQEFQDKIQEVLNTLPPVCKRVFLLSRYEELSRQEIADQLNIAVNTVDNHIKHALNTFRKYITLLVLLFIF